MLWLGVHFPWLALEITCRRSGLQTANDRPETEDIRALESAPTDEHPTAILDARGRVILANPAARQAGVAVGSSLATAHSIVPSLRHERRSLERERERLTLVAEALYGLSPRVCLNGPAANDPCAAGVMLEIGGSLRLFGEADELARRARELCGGFGHRAGVRWTRTPLAALILARTGAETLENVALPLAALEDSLDDRRIERLANMGIHTLGQLLALPQRGIARRFGEDLVDYLARLTGDRPDPRRGIRPAERFQASLHLLEPLNSKEALIFPIERLLSDLEHWLVARQLGAERLRWQFETSDAARKTAMPLRFATARQTRDAFLDITRLRLAQMELPDDVITVRLEAPKLVPWSTASRGLFQHLPGTPSAETEAPGELVDQLRARLGSRACYSLEAVDQHTPEQAWQSRQPLERSRPGGRQATAPASAGRSQPRRPLWLFDPPRLVQRHQLTLLRGPERIHTGWWFTAGPSAADATPGQARDYYVARHENGADCWVFIDPAERWFLHGYFS